MTTAGMRRTCWADLAVPFVVVGHHGLRACSGSPTTRLPPLKYLVAGAARRAGVAELVAARRVRAAVRHDPDAKPMAAIVIARCVALGKASSLVGAGGRRGRVRRCSSGVLPDAATVTAAGPRRRVAGLLLARLPAARRAGLLLERAGVDPGRDRARRRERGPRPTARSVRW